MKQRGTKAKGITLGGVLTQLLPWALLCGLFEGPAADPDVRRRLTEQAERVGREALHARLAAVDAAAAARIHPNNVRRVVRALEVWELTGRPISSFQRSTCAD